MSLLLKKLALSKFLFIRPTEVSANRDPGQLSSYDEGNVKEKSSSSLLFVDIQYRSGSIKLKPISGIQCC